MGVELTRDDLDRLTDGAPGPDRLVELLEDVFIAVDPDELDAIETSGISDERASA